MFFLSLDSFRKVPRFSWPLLILIFILTLVGLFALFSAGEGHLNPWALKQFYKVLLGFLVLFFLSIISPQFMMDIAYPFYGICLLLLIFVEFFGKIGMGAQRWINLGFIELQPSEFMKIALILALSKYLHLNPLFPNFLWKNFWTTLLMILIPAIFVLKQPDLGTASLLILCGSSLLFVSGLPKKLILRFLGLGLISLPIFWNSLHDYQKKRIFTFLDPEKDRLGSGYHVLQSKISVGSGGFWGKGFLNGTQSHLDFLPEKHTDFIFTVISEEWGFVGGLILCLIYIGILYHTFKIALHAQSLFGRLLTFGVGIMFFFYVTINIAMVTGIFPVVGVPLPFVSYGGTSLLSLFVCFGWVMNIHVHKNIRM